MNSGYAKKGGLKLRYLLDGSGNDKKEGGLPGG